MTKIPQPHPTVYFDGGCPVCSREIAMYQRQPGAQNVGWIDVSRCDTAELGADLTREQAMARLYLRQQDGSLVSGAEAFTSLWKHLPRWAWLGKLLGTPATLWALELGYKAFLLMRRTWRPAASQAVK